MSSSSQVSKDIEMPVLLTMTPRAADISEDIDVRRVVDAMVDTSDLIALNA